MKDRCKIVYVDGKQLLAMPDGTIIPGQLLSRVHDEINCFPTALVKVYIDLSDVKEIKSK
jgi:hypothetical protein